MIDVIGSFSTVSPNYISALEINVVSWLCGFTCSTLSNYKEWQKKLKPLSMGLALHSTYYKTPWTGTVLKLNSTITTLAVGDGDCNEADLPPAQ